MRKKQCGIDILRGNKFIDVLLILYSILVKSIALLCLRRRLRPQSAKASRDLWNLS